MHTFDAPALTMTVLLEESRMSMAISDGRAIGLITSLQLAPCTLAPLAELAPASHLELQTRGAGLFARLFPEKIRLLLRHSPPRDLCLQLDAKLLDIPWEMAFDGKNFLGEKFQIARRIVSDATLAFTPRVDLHRETLRVLLVLGTGSSQAHNDYSNALATRLRTMEYLVVTEASAQALERPALLRLADESDVVHCIDAIDPSLHPATAHTLPLVWNDLARQAKTAQLLVFDSLASTAGQTSNTAWLQTACHRSAPVLVQTHWMDGHNSVDGMHALYRGLAQGLALGEAVRLARVEGLQHSAHHDSAGRRPWTPALYGDAKLVLQPASDRPGLGDHLRQVTAMSCDLVESTKLLGVWGAERYSDMLDSYHAACAGIVARWGGISDSPQGDDGVMCYFGIPLAYEDSAARALRAGLEILQMVTQLGIQVRLGVVTGHVVVKAGQPFGVSLHLAARLQSIARPNTLVASDSTRQIVKNKFIFERLDSLPQLKGFSLTTTAYQVLGEVLDGTTQPREGAPPRTPFVGRDAEIHLLETHWTGVQTGALRCVLVSGEAGMGKSRLASEFRRRLTARSHRAIECRCTPEHIHSAFHPLIDLLRRRLRLGDDDTTEAKLDRIRHRLPQEMAHDGNLALVASLLSVPVEGHLSPPKTSAEKQRQGTLDVLVAWLLQETRRGPVCLVVEDLQWIDPSTREFLHRVVAEAEQAPLLILLTLRSEQPPPHDPGFAVHEIPLKGLSPDATRAMILTACGPSAVPGEMVQLLAEKADGVPLFIEESARMVMDLGVQAHSGDAALAARFSVPTTIHDLLMARLDRLAGAKQVAQVGATIGREFSLPLLQAILGHETSPIGLNHLPAQLATLVRSGLLVEKGSGASANYFFKHALVRDAAYGSLWERDRKRLHRTIANVVREQFQDLAQSQPELLAHHFAQSGNDAQALEYWERAARRAAARSAHMEATNHLRSGLGLLARLPAVPERDRTELRLQLMLAGQLIATHGYGADQVGHAYERAAELCQRAGDEAAQMKTLLGLEGYHFMRADFERAHIIARQATAMLGDSVDPIRKIQLQWAVGNILFHQGEFAATVERLDACLVAYDAIPHHPSMVQDPGVICLCYSAWALWEIGQADQALARAQKAVAVAEQLEHKFSMAEAYAFCASVHLFRGEHPQALQCAQRARDICQENGFAVWLAYAQLLHGRLVAELGDPAAGVEEMRQAYGMWVSTGAVVTRPLYLAMQAEGLALAGRPDEGLAVLAQAFEMVCQYKEHYHEAEVRRLTGELILQSAAQHGQDRSLEAQQWLLGALEFARAHQHHAAALRSATSLGRLWQTQGRPQDAWHILKLEYDAVTEGYYTQDVQAASALLEQLQLVSSTPILA
ncbi:class 3 adenylate cyclase/predicted ATPase [Rhodoferax ferrireducens]|uniref:Class 3 adenylate cyclase/predicted ATPase n=1 Tax=Rhodoferax ferrireducens TaxID=192843 RepID=A0ABU2CCQ3_9BURK|nr:AAA family ATPase [Rhodoferax ferrireducens]MDR7379111.1 class 3 adenylate cyclase/predicted ATPase [Rhodoferax ferrireducens]